MPLSTSPGRGGPGIESITMAKLFVCAGALLQLSGGEIPAPSQVNSLGSAPPSTKSLLVRVNDSSFFIELVDEAAEATLPDLVLEVDGALICFRNKIVLSSRRSDDQMSLVFELHVISKYPSFTPTSSFVKSEAFSQVLSL